MASQKSRGQELHFPACSGQSTWPPGSSESQDYISRHALGSQHGLPEVRSPRTTFPGMLRAPNMASRKFGVPGLHFPVCSGQSTWPTGSSESQDYISRYALGSQHGPPEAWCRNTTPPRIPWTAGTANQRPSFRELHLTALTVTLALTSLTQKSLKP